MNYFLTGFEKAAAAKSLISVNKNLTPGLKAYEKGGKLSKPNTVTPGESIAPRSDMPKLPTMASVNTKHNLSASIPKSEAPRVKVPKP